MSSNKLVCMSTASVYTLAGRKKYCKIKNIKNIKVHSCYKEYFCLVALGYRKLNEELPLNKNSKKVQINPTLLTYNFKMKI